LGGRSLPKRESERAGGLLEWKTNALEVITTGDATTIEDYELWGSWLENKNSVERRPKEARRVGLSRGPGLF
jgi:hypothetical protein